MRRWFNSGRGNPPAAGARGHALAGSLRAAFVPAPWTNRSLGLCPRRPLEELAVGKDNVAGEVAGCPAGDHAWLSILAETDEGVFRAVAGIAGEHPAVVPPIRA